MPNAMFHVSTVPSVAIVPSYRSCWYRSTLSWKSQSASGYGSQLPAPKKRFGRSSSRAIIKRPPWKPLKSRARRSQPSSTIRQRSAYGAIAASQPSS